MRLTLRTMLAYLDDLLEPADREAIGQRIEETDFARRLIQRVRDCMRNPRLPRPKLVSKVSGMDPNTVAEYLDNTLAGERVPEYEKVCLPSASAGPELAESDVYLAETASCHQILAMVLGQPAQIDQEMKRRMYGILAKAEQPAVAAPAKLAAPAADGLATASLDDFEIRPARRKPEVPEYLRQPAKRTPWKPIVAAVALLLLLAVTITMALGPMDTNPVARFFGFGHAPGDQVAENKGENKPVDNTATEKPGDKGLATDMAAPAPTGPRGTASITPENSGAGVPPMEPQANGITPPANGVAVPSLTGNPGDAASSAMAGPGGASAAPVNPTPPVPTPNGADANSGAQNPAMMAPNSGVASVAPATTPIPPQSTQPAPGDTGSVPPPVPQPGSTASTIPESTVPAPGNGAPTPGDGSTAMTPTNPVPGNATPGNPAGAAIPPQEPVLGDKPLGKYLVAKDTVLLRQNKSTGQFARIPPGGNVSPGDSLLVLPTYRPQLALSAGITLQLPPETMIELLPPGPDGSPTVKVDFGRMVAATTGKQGTQLALDLGAARGTVTFVDSDATLAVDVRRVQFPGVNPESQEPRVIADMYVVGGQIQWTSPDGKVTVLKAPQRWLLSSTQPDAPPPAAVAATALPKWISPEQLSSTDASAAAVLASALDNDNKTLIVALNEMVGHHRIELRSMGARCLGLLDEFKPLVDAFRDEAQKPMWMTEISSVRSAIARGPATAAKVREAFQTQRGDESGKELDRMFWGYTKEQLQAGEATKLVDYLDNDSLDFRVLAFANLSDLTGKTYYYRPEAVTAARSQAVKRWHDELKTGILPKEPAATK